MAMVLLLLAVGCSPLSFPLDAEAAAKVDLSSPDWTATSGVSQGRLASSMAGVGDTNGDGYDDLAVGSHRYSVNYLHEGAAHVFLGGPSGLEATPALVVEGNAEEAYLGGPARAGGDFDADGYADVVFGAAGLDYEDATPGAVYVWYGSPSGPSDGWSYVDSATDADGFGWGSVGIGDVNGDGYDDLATSSAQDGTGTVYLFFGGPTRLGASYDVVIAGQEDGSLFGFAMLGVGDVSGDGIDDFLIAAPAKTGAASASGEVYLYLGNTSGTWSTPAWTLAGDSEEQRFGRSLALAGDVNGDGYDDLLVGGGMNGNPGGAWLFAGNGSGWDSEPSWSGVSDQDESGYGEAIAGIGDINADGYADIAVGAANYSLTLGDEGALFVHYGGPAWPSTTADYTIYGTQEGEILGKAVAGLGDVNGDGGYDFALGAAGADATYTYEGRAEAYYGDVPPADTGHPDTGGPDTGKPDTGGPDTGGPDTGPGETGVVDTAETGNPDTGVTDSGTTDSGVTDSGSTDSGAADSGVELNDGEKGGFYRGGCGCAAGSGSAPALGVVLAAAALVRRRRR